jgi:hypothetical protein
MTSPLDDLAAKSRQLRAREFGKLLQCIALSTDDVPARDVALEVLSPDSVTRILAAGGGIDQLMAEARKKAAVPSFAISNQPALAQYQSLAQALIAASRQTGAAAAALAEMQPASMRHLYGVLTGYTVGEEHTEGYWIKVGEHGFEPRAVPDYSLANIIVLTRELARFGPNVAAVMEAGIRFGMEHAHDVHFLGKLADDASPVPSVGNDDDAVRQDLKVAVAAISPGKASRLRLIMSPEAVQGLVFMRAGNGTAAFPDANLTTGGRAYSIPISLSDAAGTNVYLIDGDGYAGDEGDLFVEGASHASLRFIEAQESPSHEQLVNLFQVGAVAVKATRVYGFTKLRTAAHIISGVAWGTPEGSPSSP